MSDFFVSLAGVTAQTGKRLFRVFRVPSNVGAGTLTVTGTATESDIRRAVEQAGFEMH